MAGMARPGYGATPTTQLLPGVEQRPNYNPFGGQTGTAFYYDGVRYDGADAANGAARTAQQHKEELDRASRVQQQAPPQQMPASYSGLQQATSGGVPVSVNTPTVVSPMSDGPPVTQTGYENERLQQQTLQATGQQQQAQISADQQMAAAANAAKSGQMELAARLQADAEARRLAMFKTGSFAAPPQVTQPGIGPVDEKGARDAAFARAKEQAGATALSSLKALQDVMANSGMMGSTLESEGLSSIVGGAKSSVDGFTRDQLELDLNRAADISDRDYQGRLTQRGQDMNLLPSLMGLITASGGVY